MRTLKCDIVIVGAGPAGCLTARTAAEKGAHVILIEEHLQVGTPVNCAEGISKHGILDAGIEVKQPYISQPINRARIYAPNKKFIDLSSDKWMGYNLNRDEFDKALAENAVNAGAELMTGTRAIEAIKKDGKVIGIKAVGDNETLKINAEISVGAEGFYSIIRRSAGFTPWYSDYIPVAQYQLNGVKIDTPHTNEFHIGRTISPGGYAWVFPKSSTVANVGLGVRLYNEAPALEYLKRFVASDSRFKNAEIIKINGGICPISGVLNKIVDEGVMLVGDAAGMMMPMTGAGIHTSVAAGKIAGDVAARAVQAGDVSCTMLQEYVDRFDADWGKQIQDGRKAMKMFDRFSDEHYNMMAEVIKPDDIINLTNGINVKRTLTKIIARSPRGIISLISAYL